MTGAQLKTICTIFLGGVSLDETFFYQLINMHKDLLEMKRDWMILRNFDNSITFSSSDDYTSTKSLPTRFLRIYAPYDANSRNQTGVYIVDSTGSKTPLKPIPFARRYDYKDVDGYFYIDIANNKIGRTGTTAGTLHIFYLKGSPEITSSVEWNFPSFSHPILAYEVAIEQKGGIDWDRVNANQVPFNKETVKSINSGLALWDARLQQAELGV